MEHFNSHAHVERDGFKLTEYRVQQLISTHTLTWSVTSSALPLYLRTPISTHTLTWSVTFRRLSSPKLQQISTHTLTWSVTVYASTAVSASANFNSHAHVERDEMAPHAPMGVLNFNSHAHVERDRAITVKLPNPKIISTHTLTWSVTFLQAV